MTDFLQTVKTLSDTRPLDRAAVESALDVALRGDPDNKNRYVEIWRAFRRPESIREVELRVPLSGATRKGGMLIIDLASDPAISGEAVRTAFGAAPLLLEPEPEQPTTAPHYLVYEKSWGALRFGFTRPAWESLTTVVIDVER